jgi:hypothetical protein
MHRVLRTGVAFLAIFVVPVLQGMGTKLPKFLNGKEYLVLGAASALAVVVVILQERAQRAAAWPRPPNVDRAVDRPSRTRSRTTIVWIAIATVELGAFGGYAYWKRDAPAHGAGPTVEACLPGTWDFVSTIYWYDAPPGPVRLELEQGGKSRWTFDASGNAVRRGPIDIGGNLTSGKNAGVHYMRRVVGTAAFDYTVEPGRFATALNALVLTPTPDSTETLEQFLGGKSQGRPAHLRPDGLRYDVTCDHNSMRLTSTDTEATLRRVS